MKRETIKKLSAQIGSLLAALSITIFGFSGVGQAASYTAAISNTGPDSENSISFNDTSTCTVNNTNDITFENSVDQNATTGDANVGGDWGEWDPWLWASRGKSQAEWQQAFSSYMSEQSYVAAWEGGAGGGNTTAGDATTGNASNSNSVNVGIAIENGGCTDNPGSPGTPETPGQAGSNGQVLGASTGSGGNSAGSGGLSGIFGSLFGSGSGGVLGSSSIPSTPGTPGNPSGPEGGNSCVAGISNTGPQSTNSIACNNQPTVQANNNTTTTTSVSTGQNAGSGAATTSGNGGAGSASSGDAGNNNTTSLNLSTSN